jgi:CBS domain-containing protein
MFAKMDFDEFDDELRSMQEIMESEEISLSESDLRAPLRLLDLKRGVLVEVGTSVKECVEKMTARHIGCVLVVKGRKLKGIFTERDVLLKIAGEKIDLAKAKVDDFMTPNPKTLTIDDPIGSALRLMNQGGYRHIPVVNKKGEPLTVISVRGLIDYIVEFFPQDVLNLPPHPIRIGTNKREGG